jgi:hypothetical protein
LYVAWTDEGFFNLTGHINTWISRRRGEAYNPDFVVPSFKAVKYGVMVWLCFTARAKCRLVFWEKAWGKITQWSYMEHILPVLAEFLTQEEAITAQAHHIVQDRAPAHYARNTLQCMRERGMCLMDHPSSSPDLNLAENPIGRIKYNLLNRRERRPTNEAQLREAIEWEWAQYEQDKLAYLCETFPRRLRAVQRAGGGPTRY